MIKFNQLKVDSVNKKLIVKAEIDTENYPLYENFYISYGRVLNQMSFNGEAPTDKSSSEYRYVQSNSTSEIEMEISLNTNDTLHFQENDLFFVYITINSDNSASLAALESAPCGSDILTTVAVAYNKQYLYNEALAHIKSVGNRCVDNASLIDWILAHKYFELSIRGGRFFNAIDLWKKLNKKSSGVTLNCSCNG